MKENLQKTILFLLIFGVIFLVLNVRFKDSQDQIASCQPDQVTRSFFSEKGQEPMLLEKQKGNWFVSQGTQMYLADDELVGLVLKKMCGAKYVEKYENFLNTPEKAQIYGLEEPQYGITFEGGKDFTLKFGNLTPTGTEYYVANSRFPSTLYTTANTLDSFFKMSIQEFRSKKFFSWDNVRDLHLNFNGQDYRLTVEGDKWSAREPSMVEGDLKTLAENFKYLAFEKYLGPYHSEEEAQNYGFLTPDIQGEARGEKISEDFEITFYNGQYYLKEGPVDHFYIYIMNRKRMQAIYTVLIKLIK